MEKYLNYVEESNKLLLNLTMNYINESPNNSQRVKTPILENSFNI